MKFSIYSHSEEGLKELFRVTALEFQRGILDILKVITKQQTSHLSMTTLKVG